MFFQKKLKLSNFFFEITFFSFEISILFSKKIKIRLIQNLFYDRVRCLPLDISRY